MDPASAILLGAQGFATYRQADAQKQAAEKAAGEQIRQARRQGDALQARRIERKRQLLEAMGDVDYTAGRGNTFSTGTHARVKNIYRKRNRADDQEDRANTDTLIRQHHTAARAISKRGRNRVIETAIRGAGSILGG